MVFSKKYWCHLTNCVLNQMASSYRTNKRNGSHTVQHAMASFCIFIKLWNLKATFKKKQKNNGRLKHSQISLCHFWMGPVLSRCMSHIWSLTLCIVHCLVRALFPAEGDRRGEREGGLDTFQLDENPRNECLRVVPHFDRYHSVRIQRSHPACICNHFLQSSQGKVEDCSWLKKKERKKPCLI